MGFPSVLFRSRLQWGAQSYIKEAQTMAEEKNSPINEDSIENLSDPDVDSSVQETGEDNDFESDGAN